MRLQMELKHKKPPYRLPTMKEVEEIPPNGLKAASLFSGAGGSSLGYKMDGWQVVWANEFVSAAAETYKANHPKTFLNVSDIRDLDPDEVLKEAKVAEGDLDLLDGSPPCASFSVAGNQNESWGKDKKYSDITQKTDDLFLEFARMLKGMKPRVFVAENVPGLIQGKAKGYFLAILQRLKDSGYAVKCRVLDAKWLGVPQSRQRTIFVGVRDDLEVEPSHPRPLPYSYTVREALPWIIDARQTQVFKEKDRIFTDKSCPTVTTMGIGAKRINFVSVKAAKEQTHEANTVQHSKSRKFTIPELKRLCGFPEDFILTGPYAQQWERLGRAVPPPMMYRIAKEVRGILEKLKA